jgi:hypothetical protein
MSSLKRELLIICDASPLILLAKAGQLDLLRARLYLCERVARRRT